MNKETKYPIKYAVLELKKEGGYLVGYKNITQGFIVSKCYVMESNIVYCSDGSIKVTHKVVFPFNNISCLEDSLKNDGEYIGEKTIPSYNANNKPYPFNIVADLFDSYEEAKIIAEEKNAEHGHRLTLEVSMENPNWKEQFEILKQEFEKRLKLYYLYERLVLKATEDMKISEQLSVKEQKEVRKRINE